MRWIALLLVCTGLALAFAIRELVQGTGAPARAEGAPASLAAAEVVPPSEPAASAPARAAGAERPAAPASADSLYYQYVDGANQVQFARSLDEVPPEWRSRAGRVALPVAPPASPARARAREAPRSPAVRHSQGTFSAARSEARSDQPEIEIFTLKRCPACRAAVAYMDKRGLEYTNRDIEEEPEARDEYLEKTDGKDGVPVIDIAGEVMQGWDQRHFEALLASMRQ
jgi:glutaredoxin